MSAMRTKPTCACAAIPRAEKCLVSCMTVAVLQLTRPNRSLKLTMRNQYPTALSLRSVRATETRRASVVTLEALRHDADTRSSATKKRHARRSICVQTFSLFCCMSRACEARDPVTGPDYPNSKQQTSFAYGSCALRVSRCPRQPIDAVMSLASSVA